MQTKALIIINSIIGYPKIKVIYPSLIFKQSLTHQPHFTKEELIHKR